MKKVVSACIISLSIANTQAQHTLLHQHSSEYLYYTPVSSDVQGNVVQAGYISMPVSFGNIALAPGSIYGTSYIAKHDPATAAWLWAKKITPVNTSSYATVTSLTTDGSGNIYITGGFWGSVSFDNITLTSFNSGQYGNLEFFVAKLNSAGNFLWAKKEGSGTGDDEGMSVAVDGTGNVYVTGYITRKKRNCKNCYPAEYITDIYVAKYNNAGTKQWERKYANSNTNLWFQSYMQGNALALDANGNPYLSGRFWGSVSFGNGPGLTGTASQPNVFVAKLTTNGATQWVRTANSSNEASGNALMVDNAGNLFLGGVFQGTTVSFGNVNLSGPGGFLARYTSAGSLDWVVNTGLGTVTSIFQHSGSSVGIADEVGVSEISSANGNILSVTTLGQGNGYNILVRNAAKTPAGYVLTAVGCGSTTFSNLNLTASSSCNTNYNDLFLINYTPPAPYMRHTSGAGGRAMTADNLIVYPNPTNGILHLESKDGNLGGIEILNQSGRVVLLKHCPKRNDAIDMGNFSPGTYLLRAQNGQQTIWFVKQ